MLTIQCPDCKTSYDLGDAKIGQKVKCQCGEKFAVTKSAIQTAIETQGSAAGETGAASSGSAPPPLPTQKPKSTKTKARKTKGQRTHTDDTRAEQSGINTTVTAVTAAMGAPDQIDRFEIMSRLGEGAFGVVYRARDPMMNREVALKLPQAATFQSEDALQRFVREAQTAGRLSHPNIVTVYEVVVNEQQIYIASAFIKGRTLEEAIQAGEVDFEGAVEITRRLADALDYAHSQGIIHRDIKPANIILDDNGQPHLLDFGLARLQDERQRLSHAGSVMGTPAYMSPEQARGGKKVQVGAASDQYSLGVVLYEMLTGQRPFEGPVETVMYNVIHKDPAAPRSLKKAIPRDVETICKKAMAKESKARYQSCAELAADLQRWQTDLPIRARRVGVIGRFRRWCKRNPLVAGLTATTVALLLATAVVSVVGYVTTSAALAQSERSFRNTRKTIDELLGLVADDDLKDIPGIAPLRRKLAEKALARYEELAKDHPKDPDVQKGLGKAYASTGAIIGSIGKFREAVRTCKKGEDVLKSLVEKHPDNDEYRYELASCRHEIGNLYWLNSRHSEGYPWLKKANADVEALLKTESRNVKYRKLAAQIGNGLGNTARHIDKKPEAMRSYVKSRDLWQGLHKQFPKDPVYATGLSAPVHNIGLMHSGNKDYSKALTAYIESEKLDRLAQKLGDKSPGLASNLTIVAINKASVLQKLGQRTSSRYEYDKAVLGARRVLRENPNMHRYRDLLADHLRWAAKYRTKKDGSDDTIVRSRLQESVKLRKELTDRDPSNPRFAEQVLRSYRSLATFEKSIKRPSTAIASLKTAMEFGERVSKNFPAFAGVHQALAEIYFDRALLAVKAKDDGLALLWYDRSLRMYRKSVITKRDHVSEQYYLWAYLRIAQNAGDAARRLKDPKRAQRYDEQGLAEATRGKRRDVIEVLVYLYNKRASTRQQRGQYDEAIADWRAGIKLAEPQLKKYPWHWYIRQGIAGAYLNIAKTAEKQKNWREEVLARRKWLTIWGARQHSLKTAGYVESSRPTTRTEAARLRLYTSRKLTMKKFTIPCDFGGVKSPFDVYITNTPPKADPLGDQAKWLWEERGGKIPDDVRDSFRKLRALADKNKVSFPDLCVYALNAANKDKNKKKKTTKPKTRKR